MNTTKLIACLVALQIFGGLHLKAAEQHELRDWTDVQGRRISARLVDVVSADMVKIERADGVSFSVPVKTFCEADQAYIQRVQAAEKAGPGGLIELDEATWTQLKRSEGPAESNYLETSLADIVTEINLCLRRSKSTTADGKTLSVRTEPESIAEQVKITGSMARMSTSDFIKRIAYNYNLAVKMDVAGGVVLVDKNAGGKGSFFGVPVK